MRTLIKQVRMLGESEVFDVLIERNHVTKMEPKIETTADEVIEGKGQYLLPGFVDLHVHLREPGGEAKETIYSGTRAAARGGFTTICNMPNTRPVPDSKENFQQLMNKINQDAVVHVLPYASITERQLGENLVPFQELKQNGAIAFTDDGVGVQQASVMYEAMLKASAIDLPIVAHCEDNSLIYQGVMHPGEKSNQLNLPGIPSICESVQIARDVLLAEAANCHYHVCHVSTKESVRVIRDAKKAGIRVTAEVTPHHLLLIDEDIPANDANYKMNPPLRSHEDRLALIEGLMDGTIDCIATDHAPHTLEEKQSGFEQSPFGIVGLETAFSLLYTHFVKTNKWSIEDLTHWLTSKPAEIFNIDAGTIEIGKPADLVLIDTERTESINVNSFYSKGTNTPFHGKQVSGIPTATFVNGTLVYKKEDLYV
ncbi:dihydroorotase [Halalkalibacillus halophilus]|uniref:dihydroorotase n=1 Tax=Halalkalibacillus halophilus TaxID=392827 RepID=UPI0003F90F9A|nr:dihydroorotase [Halalkalibacillus halophilus]